MGSSAAGYTVQAQLRYVIQWFNEWSEMQRSDFLPILAQKFVPSAYVNGLVSGLDSLGCDDRPLSLFQCRVKLFREWSDGWSHTEKEEFLNGLKNMDADFMSKYEEEINSKLGSPVSGDVKTPSPEPENEDHVQSSRDLEEEII